MSQKYLNNIFKKIANMTLEMNNIYLFLNFVLSYIYHSNTVMYTKLVTGN